MLISQISNLHQRARSDHRMYAMDTRTVMIIRMRSDVSVQVVRSNVLVTSLMMVVQEGMPKYWL